MVEVIISFYAYIDTLCLQSQSNLKYLHILRKHKKTQNFHSTTVDLITRSGKGRALGRSYFLKRRRKCDNKLNVLRPVRSYTLIYEVAIEYITLRSINLVVFILHLGFRSTFIDIILNTSC